MVDSLDQQLDSFFSWLDKNIPGGLANIWIALSADHGVAPVPAQALALGMPAATIDMAKFLASLNDSMNAKFSPGEKVEYLLPQQELPYLALNRPSFEVAGINEQEAEQAIQQAIPAAVAALLRRTATAGERQRPLPAANRANHPDAQPPAALARTAPAARLQAALQDSLAAPLAAAKASHQRHRPRRQSASLPTPSSCTPTPASSLPRANCPHRSGDCCWPTATAPMAGGTSW